MAPLPQIEVERWFKAAREALKAEPQQVPGPYGEPVSVAYETTGTRRAVMNGFIENERREFVPIELEVATGVVVSLDDVRVYLD